MAQSGVRSVAAAAVGWIIVALVAYLALGLVIGTLLWVLRLVVIVVVVGALASIYFRLRSD